MTGAIHQTFLNERVRPFQALGLLCWPHFSTMSEGRFLSSKGGWFALHQRPAKPLLTKRGNLYKYTIEETPLAWTRAFCD